MRRARLAPLLALSLALTPAAALPPPAPLVGVPATDAANDVTFPSADGSVILAGTLLLPEGEGPFPGVVLVSTRGAHTRDGVSFGKPFLKTIAERLARAGIATLRYDDRGVGDSSGSFLDATIDDFAADARGALKFLGSQPDVPRHRIAMLGHGEGGLAAIAVASDADFRGPLVLIGTPAVAGPDMLADEQARTLRGAGVDEPRIAEIVAGQRRVVSAMIADNEQELRDAVAELIAMHYETQFGRPPPAEVMRTNIPQALEQARDPRMLAMARLDPAASLREAAAPTLAIYGRLDNSLTLDLNLGPMAEALGEAGRPSSRVVVFPTKNHLLQDARTGRPGESANLGDAPAPDALELITDWLSTRLGVPSR